MRFRKFRRKLYSKIPILLSLTFLVLVVFLFLFFFSKEIIAKHTFFVSPLARFSAKEGSLENLLYGSNIQFSKVESASDSSRAVYLRDQGIVYFDLKKNLKDQISSLQLILSRLTIEGKKFKKLDLRFDKPIIEF